MALIIVDSYSYVLNVYRTPELLWFLMVALHVPGTLS